MAVRAGADALPVAMTDPAGRFTYVNAAFEHLTGFAAEALLGASHARLRHDETPAQVLQDMRRTLRAGRPWSVTLRIRRRDGGTRWVRAHVAPLIDGTAIIGHLAVLTDPFPKEILQARAMQAKAASGAARGARLEAGRWMPTGVAGAWRARLTGSLAARHGLAVGALVATSLASLWAVAPAGPLPWLASVLQIGAALALCGAFRRSVVAPLATLERTALRLVSCDLDARAGIGRDDEVGRLARALDHLAVNFAAVVRDMREGASESRIESGIESAIESGVEPRAPRANAVASASDGVMGIASQVHALALQASIEAVRLGDGGRGLSRLSEEVRRLARDSVDAARLAATPDAAPSAWALARAAVRARRLARALDAPAPDSD